MSKFVKLPSGLIVNLDRIDRVKPSPASSTLRDELGFEHPLPLNSPLRHSGYELYQSGEGDSFRLTQEDGDALLAAMGVES